MHADVDERFHEEENVRGAAATQRRRHIQQALIFDSDFLPQRAEQGARPAAFALKHSGTRQPDGDALPDLRRCIGHRADDALRAQPIR